MNIETKKYQLIHQILRVQDEQLIDTVKHLLDFGLKNETTESEVITDFWDEMTTKQKERLELSLQEVEKGIGIPHDEVMSEFRAKYQ